MEFANPASQQGMPSAVEEPKEEEKKFCEAINVSKWRRALTTHNSSNIGLDHARSDPLPALDLPTIPIATLTCCQMTRGHSSTATLQSDEQVSSYLMLKSCTQPPTTPHPSPAHTENVEIGLNNLKYIFYKTIKNDRKLVSNN